MIIFGFSGLPRKLSLIFTSLLAWFLALMLLAPPGLAGGAPAAEDNHGAGAGEDSAGLKDIVHPIMSAAGYFSELGRGGYRIYTDNCADCHGTYGKAKDGVVNLVNSDIFEGYRGRRKFHERYNALEDIHRGSSDTGKLVEFNELEIVAKYLRELRQWSDRQDDQGEKH